MAAPAPTVAIIGAGLAGLALALALHQQAIPCTVYESRAAPLNIGGAVMLSPNALRVLDALGLYSGLKTKGYNFERLEFRDVDGQLGETYEFGSAEKYGYKALRIYRHELISELVAALRARGVAVRYGVKFSHVVADDEGSGGVTFAFVDGTTAAASVLVGADGIHSTVRRHLYPDLQPRFIGMAGITAAVPTAQLELAADSPFRHLPVTITADEGAAFVMAPQRADGSEVLIGKQQRVEVEKDRAGWEAALADRDAAVRFLQEGAASFPDVVRKATARIDPATVNVWPFYVVPRLDRWASASRRVLLVGDAAHAIPPSAGQGINQAFEDVYMLGLLMGRSREMAGMDAALAFWQSYRQARVDRVLELNSQIDLRRLPADKVVASRVSKEQFDDLSWLYAPDIRGDVDAWVSQHVSGGEAEN